MKILAIGDIHGKDIWKSIEDIPYLLNVGTAVEFDFDKYIFLGDYTDAFDKTGDVIRENLIDIINFKKMYPDKVELLLGNHDLQYMFSNKTHGCSGFNSLFYFDLHEIFNKNRDLFKVAFQYKNWIFSHAGVNEFWYEHEFPYKSSNIADDLNNAFLEKVNSLFDVSFYRGGFKQFAGPFWADMTEMINEPLPAYHQVVGHTRVTDIFTHEKDKDTSVTFIDCLDNNKKVFIKEL